MPEDMSDRMPEDMPDRMPDRMPEDLPDRMPEDLPVRECINVMVGITRSKVIFYLFTFPLTLYQHRHVLAQEGPKVQELHGACQRGALFEDDMCRWSSRYVFFWNITVSYLYHHIIFISYSYINKIHTYDLHIHVNHWCSGKKVDPHLEPSWVARRDRPSQKPSGWHRDGSHGPFL